MMSFLLISLIFVFQANSATVSAESNVSRRAASMPYCDSERPNSWATHRTLTIPESCIQGSVMEIAMANALCCVYTHVVVVAGDFTNRVPYLETYDGSMYAYGECSTIDNDNESSTETYTSINVMEDVMGNVCGMSMGSRDCFDQAACIEDAKTIPPAPIEFVEPPTMSAYPSPTGSSIPTDIPTPITLGSNYTNATIFSSFPNSSSSPSPSEALSSQPSWNINTNATISLVSPLEQNPPSGSPQLFSPTILSLAYFGSVCAAYHFLI